MDNKQIIKEFKDSFNTYLKGFTSGRFEQDKDTYFDYRVALANRLADSYTKLTEKRWQDAKQIAIDNIFYYKERLQRNELMFGKQSKTYNDLYTKLRVAEFVCNSLPYIEE